MRKPSLAQMINAASMKVSRLKWIYRHVTCAIAVSGLPANDNGGHAVRAPNLECFHYCRVVTDDIGDEFAFHQINGVLQGYRRAILANDLAFGQQVDSKKGTDLQSCSRHNSPPQALIFFTRRHSSAKPDHWVCFLTPPGEHDRRV